MDFMDSFMDYDDISLIYSKVITGEEKDEGDDMCRQRKCHSAITPLHLSFRVHFDATCTAGNTINIGLDYPKIR